MILDGFMIPGEATSVLYRANAVNRREKLLNNNRGESSKLLERILKANAIRASSKRLAASSSVMGAPRSSKATIRSE